MHLSAQIQVYEALPNNDSIVICYDSLLKISPEKFDSIVLSQLEAPPNGSIFDACLNCSGTIYYIFKHICDSLHSSSKLRSLGIIDSAFYPQFEKIYTLFKKHAQLGKHKSYSIVIPIYITIYSSQDSIYLLKPKSTKHFKNIYAINKHPNNVMFNPLKTMSLAKPTNLNECIMQVDQMLSVETKVEIAEWDEKYFMSVCHFGLGTWIRNNWKLWHGSELSKYFNNLGIFHPDDMSSIILTSYYRNSKGKDIMLNEQVKYYINYWKK